MGKTSKKGVGAQRNRLKVTPELFNELKLLGTSMIDENHHEVPCPVPEEIVVSKRPPSLKEQMQRLIRTELSAQMSNQGMETFEESDDFEIEDDGDPLSGYEVYDMIPEVPIEQDPDKAAQPDTADKAVEDNKNMETTE